MIFSPSNPYKAELKKIETVRLKFAAADLSSIKKNSFDQKKDNWRNDRRDQSEEKKELTNEKQEPPKKVEKTYYRALPTVSGLKLDQTLLSKLCEMGFDRALATQGMGTRVGQRSMDREGFPGRPRLSYKQLCKRLIMIFI